MKKRKMKVILVVFSVLTVVIINRVEGKLDLAGLKKSVKPLKGTCMKSSGATEEQVLTLQRGEFPPEKELMCYYKCIFQKMKVLKDGKFVIDMLTAQTKALVEDSLAARMYPLIDKCGPLTANEDVCQAAYDYVKCCYETDSSVAFFP